MSTNAGIHTASPLLRDVRRLYHELDTHALHRIVMPPERSEQLARIAFDALLELAADEE